MQASGLEICFEVVDDLAVKGDPEDLKEVFFNLILNGIQAIEGDCTERQLTVQAQRLQSGVEVRVSDTGPGISEENQARIFEPFFTTKASGTGLGLAIVKRDVERMGGAIEVANADGTGAVFAVQLPGGG